MRRRNFFAFFAALFGGGAGIQTIERSVGADKPNIKAIGAAASSLRLPGVIEDRIRAEFDRIGNAMIDPAISAERQAQFYAARQALAWAIDPDGFKTPGETVSRNLCYWPAWDGNAIGAGEFADA